MKDNMNMNDDIKITEVDKTEDQKILDSMNDEAKETAAFILNKVSEALLKEYSAMQEVLKDTIDNEAEIDKQLDEIEKAVTDVNKDIEIQVGIIDTLERRIKNEKEDTAIKTLMGVRDETLIYIEQLKGNLESYAESVAKIEDDMRKIKESKVYLTIGSEVLINFGIKYGLVVEKRDDE